MTDQEPQDLETRLEAAAEAAIQFKKQYRQLLKSGLDENDLKDRLDAAEDLIEARDAKRKQSLKTKEIVRKF